MHPTSIVNINRNTITTIHQKAWYDHDNSTMWVYLKVQVVSASSPATSGTTSSPIRIFVRRSTSRCTTSCAFDILVGELTLELDFERGHGSDQLRTRLLQDGFWSYSAVGLDLNNEIGVERMRDFITSEENLGHREELAVEDSI